MKVVWWEGGMHFHMIRDWHLDSSPLSRRQLISTDGYLSSLAF